MPRLNKALAEAGIASRRHCEKLIASKKVFINGKLAEKPSIEIDWEKDVISIDGKKIKPIEKKFYFMLNKPPGYHCSNKRIEKEKLYLDLFDTKEKLFSVGRLDKKTAGLLLVTNDGAFAQRVIHPSFSLTKEYLVKVSQWLTSSDLEALSEGVEIDGVWIRPTHVKKVRKGTVKIGVKEGKKHEVRILVKKANLHLLELTRIRIGPLVLGNLPLGAYRELSPKELLFFAPDKKPSMKKAPFKHKG